MKKRILSLALALVMCLGLLSAGAFAAGETFTFTTTTGITITATKIAEIDAEIYGYYDNLLRYSKMDMTTFDRTEGYLDYQGNEINPSLYQDKELMGIYDGLILVRGSGFMDFQGNAVIPGSYAVATGFSEGLAYLDESVSDNEPGCFVNTSGQSVLTMPLYNNAERGSTPYTIVTPFHDGYAIIRSWENESEHFHLLDKSGNVTHLTLPTLEKGCSISGSVGDGLIPVITDMTGMQKHGAMDLNGNLVIPCEYEFLGSFSNGMALAWTWDSRPQNVLINTQNEVVLNFGDGWDVKNFYNGVGIAQGPGGYYRLDMDGAASVPVVTPEPVQPAGLTATPTASTVTVNGVPTAFDAYNIGGANYFKLRDLAFVLNDTEKHFGVGWDGETNTIHLHSARFYTPVGGEMTPGNGLVQTPVPTSSKLVINNVEVTLEAYNIGGNNYFKLRDIGSAFDFGVDWDGASNTVVIDTSKGYTPD